MDKMDLERLLNTNRKDAGDRYQAASVIMRECGDPEMADALKLLSAQMDFDDNESASDAIERSRKKLDELIAEREKHHADQYIKELCDEEILRISGGEVTHYDYDSVKSSFIKGGLYDPDIFGGDGKIAQAASDEKTDLNGYGRGIGHINLPCRVILSKHYRIVAALLHMSEPDVDAVIHYARYVVTDPKNTDLHIGDVLDEAGYQEYGSDIAAFSGADALYELLMGLGYTDAPQRLAFETLAVIPPRFRVMVYLTDKKCMSRNEVTECYRKIIMRSNRVKKLMGLGNAPDIIMRNEKRILCEYVEELYNVLRKEKRYALEKISNKHYRVTYLANLALAMRERKIGFPYAKGEKTGDIESLNLYPETVKYKDENGNISDITFEEVIDSCAGEITNYEMHHAVVLKGEEPDEEEQKLIDKAGAHSDHLHEILNSIWNGAEEMREKFMVQYNKDLNFYEPCA